MAHDERFIAKRNLPIAIKHVLFLNFLFSPAFDKFTLNTILYKSILIVYTIVYLIRYILNLNEEAMRGAYLVWMVLAALIFGSISRTRIIIAEKKQSR